MAITKDQIFAAADRLTADGQRPTLEAVRQITGGSYTTISPALNEWKAKQTATAAPLRDPAPASVTERLAEVGAEIWAVALDLANARLATEREALEKVRAELEADRAEATELADRLAEQVEELQARLTSIEAAEATARTEADELRAQMAGVLEQAHTAETRAQEIERRADELRTELDRAHQETDQVRTAFDAERETRRQAEQRAAVLEARLTDGQERIRIAEDRLTEAEKRVRVAEQEAGRLNVQVQAQQTALDQAAHEMDVAKRTTAEAQEQARKSMEEAAELRGRLKSVAEIEPLSRPEGEAGSLALPLPPEHPL